MYKLCTTEKTAQQQRQFAKVFLELALEMPYDDITISELCRRAGLSRKIFYRLFERKADVLSALLDQAMMDSRLYQPPATVREGGLHRFLAFWQSQKPLLDMLEKIQGSSMLTEAAIRHILQEDGEYQKLLGVTEEAYGREALIFYVSGIFALVLDWHKQDFARSIDQLSEAMLYLLTTSPVKR